MLDPSNESTHLGYAQRDASADRLWLTQRTKVNPWEHRTSGDTEGEERPGAEPGAAKPASAAPSPMIPQDDTLRLDASRQAEVDNPFERLIEHQLQLRLPDDK